VSELLIAAPLRLEQAMIRAGMRRSRPAGRGARVRHTGMGPRRARAAVPELLADPARALLVMGFCGGLDDEGMVGEAVVADTVQGPDGERVACAGAAALAAALERGGLRVRRGVVASVPRLAMGETRTRLREGGALAVDME
jgi:4-hydroxy-3-methylbut-2-en-1-yl diphosphate reductase